MASNHGVGKRAGLSEEPALHLGALDPNREIGSSTVRKQHLILKALLRQGKIAVQTEAMIDSGATGMFIDKTFAQQLGLKQYRKPHPIKLSLFDGQYAEPITHSTYADIEIDNVVQHLKLEVSNVSRYPLVLGLPWLKMYNPTIDWETETILLSSRDLVAAEAASEDSKLTEVVPPSLHDYLDVFSEEEAKELPPHRSWDMKIDLKEGASQEHKAPIYPLSPQMLEAQKKWLDEHLAKGFIRPSKSPMTTSTFFVGKKDDQGKYSNVRLVVDYRHLNKLTVKNRYPIPLIGNLTDQLNHAKVFTKMDLRYGYHLARIAEGDEWKTAFSTRHGQYEYLVMPLGLCNAPAVFQHMMNEIFFDMLDKGVVIYLDDILVYATTEEENIRITREVLHRLRQHKLFVKPGKCRFLVPKVEFLGVLVSSEGLEMDPGKVDAVRDWPAPTKIKEVQSFLGFCNFYRRFIPAFSRTARPLNELTRKTQKWEWTQKHQEAFTSLKREFQVGKILVHPNPDKQFFVETDSSGFALAGELSQKDENGRRRPVAFFSKAMSPAERNYDIHDKELLAIVRAFQQWRHYLEGAQYRVIVHSDHSNLQIFANKIIGTERHARWNEFLGWFDFEIRHQPGTASGRTDALSRRVDYVPAERPELEQRIFRPDQLVAAATQVVYNDEADLLEGILMLLREDDTVKDKLQYIESTGREIEDWSKPKKFLLRKGKIYVPKHKELRKAVMHLFHDTLMGGHGGAKATLDLAGRQYYWPNMARDIEDYVAGCDICKRTKSRRHAPYGKLLPLPTPDRKWTHISFDFITGLPESEGQDTILVVVDRFSKGVHLIPCKEEGLDAEKTARLFLDNVWKLHGTPLQTVSDRGTQFNNQFMKRLNELLGIKGSLSTAYHPQSDGQTERLNQVVEHFLRCFIADTQEDWVKLLPMAEFCYNNHNSSTTNSSPFFVWYGEHPAFNAQSPREEYVPAAEELAKQMQETNREVKAMIEIAQRRYKEQADKGRAEDPDFSVGDTVWLNRKNMNSHRPSKKLDWTHYGPYKVLEKVGKRAYRLDLPATIKVHPVFHVSLLEKDNPDNWERTPQPLPPVFVDGEEEWEVDKIVNSKTDRGKRKYLVRWKGFGISGDTWEPLEHLTGVEDLIEKFHLDNPNAVGSPNAKEPAKRKGRKKT